MLNHTESVCPRCGFEIEPLAIPKREAVRFVGGMEKLVARWLHYKWIKVVRQGGKGIHTAIDYASLKAAYERFKKGEEPPLLPSEFEALKRKNSVTQPISSSGHATCPP
jgi:hypothetical protein